MTHKAKWFREMCSKCFDQLAVVSVQSQCRPDRDGGRFISTLDTFFAFKLLLSKIITTNLDVVGAN